MADGIDAIDDNLPIIKSEILLNNGLWINKFFMKFLVLMYV